MAAQKVSLDTIEGFLRQKRIAMIGASRDPKHFSSYLLNELVKRGYDMVPVNPNAKDIAGRRCFARVQDIAPPVDAALLMTSSTVTDAAVSDCAEAGIRRVWMYGAGGNDGAVSATAVEFCGEQGIDVVPGQCPFMFLPHNGFHAIHGFIRKVTGKYPRHVKSA